jgi:hypothetical protein
MQHGAGKIFFITIDSGLKQTYFEKVRRLQKFQTLCVPILGLMGILAISMQSPWLFVECTIREEVMAPPKFGPYEFKACL